jgi:hypothetical protein
MNVLSLLPAAVVLCSAGAPRAPGALPLPWGEQGHRLIGAAAAAALPGEVPAFFRESGARLSYLNPEPDRWRGRGAAELSAATAPDHFIDFEDVPDGALAQPDRWSYLRYLYRNTRLEQPERAGFLPYQILELYEELLAEWRLWRAASPEERPFIEQRIVDVAGILGHYVADGSQPLHVTAKFNGWPANAPNPERFSTATGLHARFETDYVRAHVPAGMALGVRGEATRLDDVPAAIRAYLYRSNDQVLPLYRMDRDGAFDPTRPPRPEALRFVIDRMGDGATMLRDLWWTAWLKSEPR